MRHLFSPLAAVAVALALPVLAQTAPPAQSHIRGEVKSLDGDTLVVQTREGPAATVKLAPAWSVVVMNPVDVATIQPGSFIGTTEVAKPDGTGQSLEVHVFPLGVKAGEGHYPWDLKPNTMMTNGTIGKVETSGNGRTLEVAYPGGSRQVLVPPGVPVVAIGAGDRAMVKPGAKVFIIAAPAPDGALAADRVVVGQNGAAPPM
jgi:hypothetical protein